MIMIGKRRAHTRAHQRAARGASNAISPSTRPGKSFEDGNGRVPRWLIHHVLERAGFSPPGLIFPIRAVILRKLQSYRRVLEAYSKPLLKLIEWRPTAAGNVAVLNHTKKFLPIF